MNGVALAKEYDSLVFILKELEKVKRRWKNVEITRIAINWFFLLFSVLLPIFILDNIFHLKTIICVLCFISIVIINVYFGHKGFKNFFGTHTDDWTAVQVERYFPFLKNRLINTIQLAREFGNSSFWVKTLAEETLDCAKENKFIECIDTKPLRKRGLLSLILSVVVFIYVGVFPNYFFNAAGRMFLPFLSIAPITKTQISVEPGDKILLRGENVTITAKLGGEIVQEAKFLVKGELGAYSVEATDKNTESALKLKNRRWENFDMIRQNENIYSITLKEVKGELKYKISAGDAQAGAYKISVVDEPMIVSYLADVKLPEYTLEGSKKTKQTSGDYYVLFGSEIQLKFTANNPIEKAKMSLRGQQKLAVAISENEPIDLEVKDRDITGPKLKIDRDYSYSVKLLDSRRYENRISVVNNIFAVKDKLPKVQFIMPGKNIKVTEDTNLNLMFSATDDYGIKEMQLCYQINEDKDARILWKQLYNSPVKIKTQECKISPQDLKLKAGSVLSYWAQVVDNNNITGPGKSLSPVYTITIVTSMEKMLNSMEKLANSKKLESTESKKAFIDVTLVLKEILKKQKEIRKETVESAKKDKLNQLSVIETGLKIRASECRENYINIASKSEDLELKMKCEQLISGLQDYQIENLMGEASKHLEGSKVYFAQGKEDEVITKLGLILRTADKFIAEFTKKDNISKIEAIKDTISALKKFVDEQKTVVIRAENIKEKPVDTFTEKEVEDLSKLADVEEALRKELSKASDDLRRATEKDLGAGVLVNTLENIIEHVERAEGEFKKVTITLDATEMWKYIALAEQLQTDLQMWLPNKPDMIEWNVANPLEDYDVPLPELPEELQDVVGDLIETEEEMDENTDNVITGGWNDSIPQAGWAVMDGPISDFTASGKTGNMLPKNNELSGRSGEGRAGKSAGEMVEKEFVGKDGRTIPPRLSDERLQKGVVQEKRHKPNMGSTGGGKLGGWGAEGLTDNVPPQLQM